MPSERTFHRTVIQVEVLSEEPFEFDDLTDMADAILTGDCSGDVKIIVDNEEVDGKKMAALLIAQGSDPSFFGLDDDGEDDEAKAAEEEPG